MSGEKESGTAKNWKANAGVILRGLGVTAILFLGYTIFRAPIEDLLSKVVVGPILSKIQPGWGWYLALWVAIGAVLAFPNKKKKWVIGFPKKLYPLVCSVIGIYLSYRVFGWDRWELYPLNGGIKYWDIPALIIALMSMFDIGKSIKNNRSLGLPDSSPVENKGFIGPGNKPAKIEFGFEEGAAILYNLISDSPTEEALAIGINGVWGSGKTTFLDQIKLKIDQTKIDGKKTRVKNLPQNVIIDFHPWRSSSPNGIIHDFFEELQKELEKHSPDLGRKIAHYAEKLVAFEDSIFTKMLHLGAGLLYGTHTQAEQYDAIKKLIGSLNLKIHIFIDDMDRLGADEIMEVIRIVRNTGNFPNINYYLAYDNEYLHQQLSVKQVPNPVRFMEKIVQVNYEVPKMDPEELWNLFTEEFSCRLVVQLELKKEERKNKLRSFFNQVNQEYPIEFDTEIDKIYSIDSKEIKTSFINDTSKIRSAIRPHLDSYRFIVTLTNSLIKTLPDLWGEVNFRDALLLDILRLKSPLIYNILWQEKEHVFNFPPAVDSTQNLEVIIEDREATTRPGQLPTAKKEGIQTKVRSYSNLSGHHSKENSNIIEIVELLFNKNHQKNGISVPHKFFLYFSHSLSRLQITELEFELLISKNDYLIQFIKLNPIEEARKLFNKIKNYPISNNFDTELSILEALRLMGDSFQKPSDDNQSLFGYSLLEGRIARAIVFNHNDITTAKKKEKLWNIATHSPLNKIDYFHFLRALLNTKLNDSAIEKKRIQNFGATHLNYLIKENDETIDFWFYFYALYFSKFSSEGRHTTIFLGYEKTEMTQKLKEFLLNYRLIDFLEFIIFSKMGDSGIIILKTEPIRELFQDVYELKKILNSKKDDPKINQQKLQEFLEIFDLYLKNGGQRMELEIPFKLTHLTPHSSLPWASNR